MAVTMTRHRPEVRRELRDYGLRWQMHCTCGQVGPERRKRPEAVADQSEHLAAVAAAESERCQLSDPRIHGVAWWESCQVCATQPVLFDL